MPEERLSIWKMREILPGFAVIGHTEGSESGLIH